MAKHAHLNKELSQICLSFCVTEFKIADCVGNIEMGRNIFMGNNCCLEEIISH